MRSSHFRVTRKEYAETKEFIDMVEKEIVKREKKREVKCKSGSDPIL